MSSAALWNLRVTVPTPTPETPPRPPRIAAVVVTHNRLALLQECITAIRAQTRPVDEIIVVNNASTDGTLEWLQQQSDLTVITQENSGSSGGQYTGIKTAYHKGHDWFWCMDDDTVATSMALEALIESHHFPTPTTGFLSSLVLKSDGTTHQSNVQHPSPPHEWFHSVLTSQCIPVLTSTFVSILISRSAVRVHGLPLRDFFIWYDDSEYTERLSSDFRGYLVLESQVLHKAAEGLRFPAQYVPRVQAKKYGIGLRNRVYLVRRMPLSPYVRFRQIQSLLVRHFVLVMCRKAPASVLWWGFKGLWFSPSVEHV